ncbi:MAG: sulfatase-like hydrolase/transferase [Planctomycetes bacterium]|nr:sulfatase-like hydrolase/transferase [Planctomycetota bacterium]
MPKRTSAPLIAALSLVFVGCKREPTPTLELKPESPIEAVSIPLKFKDHNIVFVSFDALQAAHVGCLGYSRNVTPTIDAIAKNGFNFTQTMSVASWTVPASMTWFTGVYPSEHRMTNKFAVYQPEMRKLANLKDLAPNLMTLAEILKQNGYVTGGFTGNAGVSGGFGYEQGFDVYYYELGKFGSIDQSIPKALEWLKTNKDKKLFLFLHGYDIHGQNTPASGFDYRFVDKKYDNKFTGSVQEQEVLREEGLEAGQVTIRDEDVRFWRAAYDEKIQRTDEKFKHFLEDYDKLGLTQKTLFVLTSDHGTELFEHRRIDHGFTLYDEQIHVPLIFKLPRQTSGTAIADRVSSIDVMPTILDLLDVQIPENAKKQLRGTSLVSTMKGEAAKRDVFSETDYRLYTYKRSIVTPDGWKLIYTLESRRRELYDLKADPGESKNLAAAEMNRAAALEEKIFAHFKSIGHDLTNRRWEIGLNPVYSSQGKEMPKK